MKLHLKNCGTSVVSKSRNIIICPSGIYSMIIYFLIRIRRSHCLQGSLFFPSNTITIILMNLFCTSCIAELTGGIYGKISKSSPSRVIWVCWLESLKIATRVDSSPSHWLDSLYNTVILHHVSLFVSRLI